jgi:hypothetical protein
MADVVFFRVMVVIGIINFFRIDYFRPTPFHWIHFSAMLAAIPCMFGWWHRREQRNAEIREARDYLEVVERRKGKRRRIPDVNRPRRDDDSAGDLTAGES